MSLSSIGTRLHTSLRPGLVAGNKQGVGPLAAQFGRKAQATAGAGKTAATGSTPVSLSEAQAHSRWLRSDRLMAAAKADPAYARQMAEAFALTPDKMTQNWADAPSPRDADAFLAWANQSVVFDKEAAPVNAERAKLYNSLKASGTPDVDILKAIINFNGTRPIDYQRKTGFWELNTKA